MLSFNKYIQNGCEIEAIHFDRTFGTVDFFEFINGIMRPNETLMLVGSGHLLIRYEDEGYSLPLKAGDYLIKDQARHVYPCPAEKFHTGQWEQGPRKYKIKKEDPAPVAPEALPVKPKKQHMFHTKWEADDGCLILKCRVCEEVFQLFPQDCIDEMVDLKIAVDNFFDAHKSCYSYE